MGPTKTYNERLFEGSGLRSWLHNSRFHWFSRTAPVYLPAAAKVVELGCFDGRLLSYFAEPPAEYAGFDAGVENGLTLAQRKFAGHPDFRFTKATVPVDLAHLPDKYFDMSVALETLEHVPARLVEGYIEQLARITKGTLLVSVPNEKGLIFLAKYIAKKAYFGSTQTYLPREVIAATLGLMHWVERDDHKGFDYAWLIRLIRKHFDVVAVGGLPVSGLPPLLSLTVTIIAKSKTQ